VVGSNCVTATDIYNEDMKTQPYIEILNISDLPIVDNSGFLNVHFKKPIDIKLWNCQNMTEEEVKNLLSQKTTNDLDFGDFEDIDIYSILSMKVFNKKGVLYDISETFKQDVVKKIIEFCHKNNETNLELVLDDKDININYRKTISKIIMAASVIAVGGRIGAGNTVLIGEKIYNIIKNNNTGTEILKIENPDFTYVGNIADLSVIYDKSIGDDNIYVYRKNSIDMPNIVVILDETPTLGNIKGAIVETGLRTHFQFKSISILDTISIDESEKNIQETLDKYSFIQKNSNHSKYNLTEHKITSIIINNDENFKTFNYSKILSDIKHSILKQITNNATELDKIIIGNIGIVDRKLVDYNILDVIINNSGDRNEINIITNGLLGVWIQDLLEFVGYVNGSGYVNGGDLYFIGAVNHSRIKINVYVDPYMKYTDKRIFIINDVRISYNKNIIRTISKSKDILNYNILYKIDKDVLSFEIEDNGNYLM
jgi:hypothetical protein